MKQVIEAGGRGISNGKGFYRYTPAEAEDWKQQFLKFNYEIRQLTMKYSAATSRKKRTR